MGDIQNKADELKGQAKEKIGNATGNEELEGEGIIEKSEANLKQAGEKVKDAAGKVKDAFS
ncbi:CsbD family protein [Nocardioides sp. AE5]|uniref:CsbD family protein n=1 Tax=Nocardioides sp. AE5 TaxID=2962573 RepID=UPI0028824C79|nr:CsbD family protein [Nocardioides sp. AE5]MDT0201484.1 CsbD family protein [Nocardioides sp. AE5]